MAIVDFTSFNWYRADFLDGGGSNTWAISNAASISYIEGYEGYPETGGGYTTQGGYRMFPYTTSGTPETVGFYRNLSGTEEHATITVGFWLKQDPAAGLMRLLSLRSDAGATTHVTVTYTPASGTFNFYRGANGGTSLGSVVAPYALTTGWQHIQIKTVAGASGSIVLSVNGVVHYTLSSVNTLNGGTKTVYDQVWLPLNLTSGLCGYDHYWITNGTGAIQNGFLGPARIHGARMGGNGDLSQLTNQAGNSTNNYASATSGNFNNKDVSVYVGSEGAQADSYNVDQDTVPTGFSPAAVRLSAYVWSTDGTDKTVRLGFRQSGTTESTPTGFTANTARRVHRIATSNPVTLSNWSAADLAAFQFYLGVD